MAVSFLPIIGGCASAKKKKPETERMGPLLLRPFMLIVRQHRKFATKTDGPRCPMYPSCSSYAHCAVVRHSLLGFFVFIDRLFFREFGALHERFVTAGAHLSSHQRYYDPLEDTLPIFSDERPSLLLEQHRDEP